MSHGAFDAQAFDNSQGTGAFYTGLHTGSEGGGGSTGAAFDLHQDYARRAREKRRIDETLSKTLRKVLGIVTPEEAEQIRLAAEAEAIRLAMEQEAARMAAELALRQNADDEEALIALANFDDDMGRAVLGVAMTLLAQKARETLH